MKESDRLKDKIIINCINYTIDKENETFLMLREMSAIYNVPIPPKLNMHYDYEKVVLDFIENKKGYIHTIPALIKAIRNVKHFSMMQENRFVIKK